MHGETTSEERLRSFKLPGHDDDDDNNDDEDDDEDDDDDDDDLIIKTSNQGLGLPLDGEWHCDRSRDRPGEGTWT